MTYDKNSNTAKPVELSDAQVQQISGGGFDIGSAAPPAKGIHSDPVDENGDGKASLVVGNKPRQSGRP